MVRMRLVSILAFSAILGVTPACGYVEHPCEERLAEFSEKYEGPVVALYSGDAYFSLGPECGVQVSGPYELHQAIANAWETSSLEGHMRPIEVSLKGALLKPKEGSKLMIFEAESIEDAIPMTSTQDLNEVMRASIEAGKNS